jgi:hypothetical protein
MNCLIIFGVSSVESSEIMISTRSIEPRLESIVFSNMVLIFDSSLYDGIPTDTVVKLFLSTR